MAKLLLQVTNETRIDKWISQNSDISRNDIKILISNGKILLNNKLIVKLNTKVVVGDKIEITELLNKEITVEPEEMELDIVYEDQDLIVINKKSGVVVHPAPGNWSKTLVNGLLFHYKNNLSDLNGIERPGIVHRLDKDTSGLMVVAKNNKAHNFLSNQLRDHSMSREYRAITVGKIDNKITHIDLPIARCRTNRKKMEVGREKSKNAITHIFELESTPTNSLVKCVLETGRTHQIRVHLAYIKRPVLNDPQYGKSTSKFNQFLHAYELKFVHPSGKKMDFKIDPPQEFLEEWNKIKNKRLI